MPSNTDSVYTKHAMGSTQIGQRCSENRCRHGWVEDGAQIVHSSAEMRCDSKRVMQNCPARMHFLSNCPHFASSFWRTVSLGHLGTASRSPAASQPLAFSLLLVNIPAPSPINSCLSLCVPFQAPCSPPCIRAFGAHGHPSFRWLRSVKAMHQMKPHASCMPTQEP